jgi:hypothetical protein
MLQGFKLAEMSNQARVLDDYQTNNQQVVSSECYETHATSLKKVAFQLAGKLAREVSCLQTVGGRGALCHKMPQNSKLKITIIQIW